MIAMSPLDGTIYLDKKQNKDSGGLCNVCLSGVG